MFAMLFCVEAGWKAAYTRFGKKKKKKKKIYSVFQMRNQRLRNIFRHNCKSKYVYDVLPYPKLMFS